MQQHANEGMQSLYVGCIFSETSVQLCSTHRTAGRDRQSSCSSPLVHTDLTAGREAAGSELHQGPHGTGGASAAPPLPWVAGWSSSCCPLSCQTQTNVLSTDLLFTKGNIACATAPLISGRLPQQAVPLLLCCSLEQLCMFSLASVNICALKNHPCSLSHHWWWWAYACTIAEKHHMLNRLHHHTAAHRAI